MHYITEKPVEATLPPNSTLLLIVDPISTSCRIAQEAAKRGHHVGAIWTTTTTLEERDPARYGCASLRYKFELVEGRDWSAASGEEIGIVQSVVIETARGFNLTIAGCITGSGLPRSSQLADGLAKQLGLSPCTTLTTMIDVRNKFTQQTLLETAGLRSIKQVRGLSLDDESIASFLDNDKYPMVVKLDEVGIQGGKIKLCHTKQDAKDHFQYLLQVIASSKNGTSAQIICQEFLRGVEVMVDSVSHNSKHKTCMVWRYDKRPANGERHVNFGMIPMASESHEAALAIPYVSQCLTAMGMKNGPSHAKCIVTIDGPILIELNFRAHGGDGSWCHLARALTGGYSQVEASVDALLDPAAFEQLPDAPLGPFNAHGLQVHLVSHSAGEVTSMPGFQVMKHLPSFVSLSTDITVGSLVDYTTSLSTSPGVCVLMNKDESKLNKDLDLVRYLEEINALFDYKTKVESLARPTAATYSKQQQKNNRMDDMEKPSLVRIFSNDPKLTRQGMLMKRMTTIDASKEVVVVVDPYSTGCLVVNEIQSRGYQVIACWTLGFSAEMKTHTPGAAGKMKYYAEVDELEELADTVRAIYEAAGKLRVVACIAGGEAGVDCADAVSERMNLRTNGTQVANRRDKKIQQELIRDAGMRSVRQAAGSKWEHVEKFLQTEHYPVVLKPTDSAGSDGVKLCHNIEEAKEHFHHLFEVEAVNGGYNTEVLCQEFLRGKEYVVDQVSRDGVHKTMMVWVYDKRPANNSAFVYFGMVPVDPNSMEAKILIPYARGVLDVLGVQNGPSHAEVILTPTGPCLVEMNVRAHGGDGNWRSLARGLTGGYSQVEVTVDSYLDKKQFSITPNLPPTPFKASGQEVILVSFSRGKVIGTPGYDVIRNLQSFVYMETGIKVGSFVERTVDLFTGIGSVILMHEDESVLNTDISRVREMELNNELFEFERSGTMLTNASQRHLSEIIVGDDF